MYLVSNTFGENVHQPAAPQLPAKYKSKPHDYIAYLNGGLLPYYDRGIFATHAQDCKSNSCVIECMLTTRHLLFQALQWLDVAIAVKEQIHTQQNVGMTCPHTLLCMPTAVF